MKKLTLLLSLLVLCISADAVTYPLRTEWTVSKKETKLGEDFLPKGKFYSKYGIPSAMTVSRAKEKISRDVELKNGRPIVHNAGKGTTLTLEMPVENVAAGTAVDFWFAFTTDDGKRHLFTFEYLDGKKWLPGLEMLKEDGTAYNLTSTVSKKDPRRICTTVRLQKAIKKGNISFRIRKEDREECSILLFGAATGQCPQITCYDSQVPKDTISLLTVGNSYTHFHTYPVMLKEMAWTQGHLIEVAPALHGGYSMENHLKNPCSTEIIDRGGYDYAFFQDQSMSGILIGSDCDQNFIPNMIAMNERVKKTSPNAKTYVEITWARKTGKESLNKQYKYTLEKHPEWYTDYESQQKRIIDNLTAEAAAASCDIIPVAMAWRIVCRERKDINLYHTDSHHPSYLGSYLIAAVVYQTLYHTPFTAEISDCRADAEKAAYLRSVAERVVLNGEM